ncbi:hypothetical protein [Alteribacillus sp. YIM 98480]|uniref:hypothetical protein n=1 Tax=Alteribacillus sp. YIM 98480 TaxID=2606599 RepID=UPI001E432FEA|nr:hypothetical protein [Alteribacillus sp. YIM 98480]
MTPREFDLKLDGFMEREAWVALLNRRAMKEKKISMDKLLGREKNVDQGNVVSIEEHKNLIHEMKNKFAK